MSTKAKVYLLNTSLNHKSRMRRESHVRFCERWGGKFPLPTRPEKLKLIEQDDPSIQSLNFRTALAEAHKHEQWLSLVKALDNADRWRVELSKGVSQADIARTEGLTRARVCQLLRLNGLDSVAKRQIRSGDERYYGVSLREVWGVSG